MIAGAAKECKAWGIVTENNTFGAILAVNTGGVNTSSNQTKCRKTLHSNATILLNRWYHVAASSDGGFVKLYVDGKLQNTGEVRRSTNFFTQIAFMIHMANLKIEL